MLLLRMADTILTSLLGLTVGREHTESPTVMVSAPQSTHAGFQLPGTVRQVTCAGIKHSGLGVGKARV